MGHLATVYQNVKCIDQISKERKIKEIFAMEKGKYGESYKLF